MKRVLTQVVAMLFVIVSMGAARGPNTTEPIAVAVNRPEPPAANGTQAQPQPIVAKLNTQKKPYQVGRASWYGKYFHGKETASGEPYDMYQLTAAHLQLPLGTYVKVTSLRTGNSVVVRINDRGPVVPGRIIDLSYSAACMLDFDARGIEKVRLDVIPTQTVARAGMH